MKKRKRTIRLLPQDIASYLSYGASQWRPNWVKRGRLPIKIFFESKNEGALDWVSLQQNLAKILKEPFVTQDWSAGVPIILANSNEDADAMVVFEERVFESGERRAYEISFKNSNDVFPGGFSFDR